jgi:hypothetical protein
METSVKLERYKQNLSIVNHEGKDYIKSYDTLVAEIDFSKQTFKRIDWYVRGMRSSSTTSKHINYAATELNLTEES